MDRRLRNPFGCEDHLVAGARGEPEGERRNRNRDDIDPEPFPERRAGTPDTLSDFGDRRHPRVDPRWGEYRDDCDARAERGSERDRDPLRHECVAQQDRVERETRERSTDGNNERLDRGEPEQCTG
jgi:hypothetical protein